MTPPVPLVGITTTDLAQLRTARVTMPVDDAVFRFEGPGAIACLQGLLTNDVVKLDDHAAAWGAFLTPKGMIVTDAWVVRDGATTWVLVPRAAHDTAQQLFRRTIPPRLAAVSDASAMTRIRWLVGGIPPPLAGATIAVPRDVAPFAALVLAQDPGAVDSRLNEQGWIAAPAAHADVARLLLGWPVLGREIDDRTLPQEVRFDELGAVRYDKGCYTGQETVARVHFRGHTNRELRGVCWAPGEYPTESEVSDGGRVIGTLRTLVRLADRSVALGVLRSGLAAGDIVRTGASEGMIVELPFDVDEPAVA